jgi:hypothetical protein
VRGQNQTPAKFDSVIANLQTLLEVANSQVQLTMNPRGLNELYSLFINQQPERELNPHTHHFYNLKAIIDYEINRQQLVHLNNYLAALSVQQNQLLTLYDMGYKPWQEVRDVMGKQTELEMNLQSISERQKLIKKNSDLSQLPGDLPVLTINIDSLEKLLQLSESHMPIDSLRLEIHRYQRLLDKYNESYHQHSLQADMIYQASLQSGNFGNSPATGLNRLMVQFEIKRQTIETKRKLYHRLIQISALVPEISIANYTELYNPVNYIKETNRELGLMYEE